MLRNLHHGFRTLRSTGGVRCFSKSAIILNNNNFKKEPPIINGLYYGKFTKQEYEDASKYIHEQIARLEKEIKGESNVRENIESMPIFPSNKKAVRVDDLSNLLSESIKTMGPLSLLAFMRQCLTHPQFGYYTTRDPLSEAGDFITSPEISSMFGEMVGIWLYATWSNQKRPQKIRLIEFGPGRGTLAHDCIKTFNRFNKGVIKQDDIELIMIEASPVLRKKQWESLCGQNEFYTTEEGFNVSQTIWGNKVKWVHTEKDIDKGSSVANYILAHEFFDALPIKSFQKTEHGWRELLVEHSPSVNDTHASLPGEQSTKADEILDPEFHLTLSPKETNSSLIPDLSPRFKNLPIDRRIEICPDAELYILKMVELLDNDRKTGGVLVIDYGTSHSIPDNSLRGIYKHKFVSPFFKPGEVDLSANVDFTNLKIITQNMCDSFGPVDQGDWLHELGIGYRAEQLIMRNNSDFNAQEKIYKAYKRLTSKEDENMGKAYKALCLLPKNSDPPIGFGGQV